MTLRVLGADSMQNKYLHNFKYLIHLSLFLVFLNTTLASDFHSPRIAALGGASHAGPILNDSIYLNPSYTSFLPSYSLGFNYGFFNGTDSNNAASNNMHGMNWNLSLLDGRSELFQAGVSFARREDARMLHIGASKAAIKELGFGLSGKFIFPTSQTQRNQVRDMVFSATGIVTDWIQAVLVVDNLFQTDAGKSQGFYREFILGTKFNIKGIMMIYFDPHLTPDLPADTFGHELGLEFTVFKDLFLRLGNFRNANVPWGNFRGRGFGTGVGWIGPRMSLDYGLSRATDPIPATSHTFGVTTYF